MNLEVFIPAEILSLPELLFLTSVYGYILYRGSRMISDGTELLLLVPSLAPVVGSVVLPVFGAMPDGVMVLFSGGSSVAVGVGTLAGSTVMLLTLLWFLGVFVGRDLQSDRVLVEASVSNTAWLMLASLFLYGAVQFPVSFNLCAQQTAVLATLCLCAVSYVSFLVFEYRRCRGRAEILAGERRVLAIQEGEVSFRGALKELIFQSRDLEESLLGPRREVQAVLSRFFVSFDKDEDGKLDEVEFTVVLNELHVDEEEARALFARACAARTEKLLDLDSFVDIMVQYVTDSMDWSHLSPGSSRRRAMSEPETPEDEQRGIKREALWKIGVGAALVLFFSEPAVDVLGELGKRLSVSAFYISFVLAPPVSNASLIIAVYNYARKKTNAGVTVALSSLVGAAIINNTFVLGALLFVVWMHGLPWTFFAEVVAVVAVVCVAGVLIIVRRSHSLLEAGIMLALYPLSLALVYVLR